MRPQAVHARGCTIAAALLCDGDEVDELALGLPVSSPAAPAGADSLQARLWQMVEERGMTLAQATEACEEMLVSAALEAEHNTRTRAAARLGITVRTIYKKLNRDVEAGAAGRPASGHGSN